MITYTNLTILSIACIPFIYLLVRKRGWFSTIFTNPENSNLSHLAQYMLAVSGILVALNGVEIISEVKQVKNMQQVILKISSDSQEILKKIEYQTKIAPEYEGIIKSPKPDLAIQDLLNRYNKTSMEFSVKALNSPTEIKRKFGTLKTNDEKRKYLDSQFELTYKSKQ